MLILRDIMREISEFINNSGKLCYSNMQLSNLMKKPINTIRVYASRLINRGIAKRIYGKLCFTDNKFIIASQVVEPAYISLHSSLYFHNLINQVPEKIEAVSTINSLKFKSYIYHKITPKLFWGFERINYLNSYIYIATPEKAIIDGLYLSAISKELIKELYPKLNKTKLKEHLKQLKKMKIKNIKKVINFLEEIGNDK
jgi:predicted transcriptional regulator of viral defense system